MSQNRVLDPAEIARLSEGQDRNNRNKPKTCKNNNCDNVFIPKRISQVYCSKRCRLTAEHAKNVADQKQLNGRVCLWCGKVLPDEKKASARYCNDRCRALAFKAKPCVYCGAVADSRDHFIPRAFVNRIQDLGWAKKADLIVPACKECNSTAGANVFRTLSQKREYIHERYRIKYKKILEMKTFTKEELEEYGYNLRTSIEQAMLARQELKARLRWPKQ